MSRASENRISVALAMDQVREACAEVNRLAMELQYQRSERNRHIQDALEFVPISQMMKVSGMSRESLYRIKNMPKDD